MTETANLGLPFIEGGQAQKHVTHNEALRILDAAIQIAVLDRTRTAPPVSPANGERHLVAAGATGAWAAHDSAITTWQDGAWAFLAPDAGWCVWSVADDGMLVFDGTHWRALGLPSLDAVPHLGINASADASNLLSVKSNAALFAAITVAAGGSGDVRVQLSKEATAKTASVVFSDNFSGRAEFGLVGSDAFKLKVSPDGASWAEALVIDQATGDVTLPRGLALTGVIAPAQITANQNDYTPAGIAAAAVLQISTDAARSLSGLGGGAEGRIVVLANVGSQPVTLLDESAASLAANRFTLGGNLVLAAKQAAILRYDGTAARWQAIAGATGMRGSNNLSDLASVATARGNLGLGGAALRGTDDYPRADAAQSLSTAQKAQAHGNLYLAPTTQVFLSGSGTYTTPANCRWIEVEMVGGGGGGGGSGTTAGAAAGSGGATTFGTSLLIANGGAGGITAGPATSGGSAGGGDINVSGGQGDPGVGAGLGAVPSYNGGRGGTSAFGGSASTQFPGGGGYPAATNSGSGGGGAVPAGTGMGGAGGGAGGFLKKIIGAPSASYAYAVGAGGAAGLAGSGGSNGGAGAAGLIRVAEHYGS